VEKYHSFLTGYKVKSHNLYKKKHCHARVHDILNTIFYEKIYVLSLTAGVTLKDLSDTNTLKRAVLF